MKITGLKIYRFVLILLAFGFFVFLLNKNMVVNGRLSAVYDFCDSSSFITHLYPENRVGGVEHENGDCFQTIFVEPAYFKVKVPRTFFQARVKITYANPDQDLFELGLMKKREFPLDWRFTLRPLDNKIFNQLDWDLITEQGVSLWQKEKKFDRIYDFVNNVPDNEKTVVWHYSFSPEAIKDETKVVGWNKETNLDYVDYIIAQYQLPEVVATKELSKKVWQQREVDFSVGGDYMNDNHLEFIFSAPGLTHSRYEIKVKKVEIELVRPPSDWSDFVYDLKKYILRKYERVREKII